MSVQSEIQRIQAAKEAIITAIRNKNMVVPSDVTLDGLPEYIKNIENANNNKIFWQELINTQEFDGLYAKTNDLKHIPLFGACTLNSQDGINYTADYGMGYEYIGVVKNIVINAGGFGMCEYDISLDNGVTWEYFMYPGFDDGIVKCFVFNSKFFFTTDTNKIYYSSNGIDWIRASNDGFFVDLYCVTPQYVIMGSDEEGFYYSTDGDVWIPIEHSFDWVSDIIYIEEYCFILSQGKFYYS